MALLLVVFVSSIALGMSVFMLVGMTVSMVVGASVPMVVGASVSGVGVGAAVVIGRCARWTVER